MSIAHHHAQWRSLLEVSEPFLSIPVLMAAFPQGLEDHDPEHFRELKLAAEEWEAAVAPGSAKKHLHLAWIEFVLKETLQLPEEVLKRGQSIPATLTASVPEHAETLRPDIAVCNPADREPAGQARLLVQVLEPGQSLDRPLAGRRWNASPDTRMTELLHRTGVRLGLVTNGEQWMLVDAPVQEATGFASWYTHVWIDEPVTLQAFRSLLGARRFFGVAEKDTLEKLLEESAKNQHEVTDQLGLQVRHAVEVLVQSLDRADRERKGTLLAGVEPGRIYEAALAVMMRLVFLFSAEERGLLRLGEELYDENYAVSTLRSELREAADQHGEGVLERRHDAWARILATFRAVHAGIEHEALRLPGYGGRLFDPDHYPLLEGRRSGTSWKTTPASPLPIDNRTVLHLLDALQMLRVKVPGTKQAEACRLSFAKLDIEQIGHVYEGLLDHTAVRAAGPVLGLEGPKGGEPEVPLTELEQAAAQGKEAVIDLLRERTGKQPKSLAGKLQYDPSGTSAPVMMVCEGNRELHDRVRPFEKLLRRDDREQLVFIPDGSLYVTQTSARRSTGTHYTPRSLTEPVVRHTLDPLVFEGPAEGKPREEWKLRSPRELLALRVCDLAMGSGAFLVQACRYLSERLCEAWDRAIESQHPAQIFITPEGDLSRGEPGEQILPQDSQERLTLARRLVAERCLYGVDRNPLAVEMAKLSLWLTTLDRNRPFTFLDHALESGDSLLGLTSLEQIENFHIDPERGKEAHHGVWDSRPLFREAVRKAVGKRRRLESFTVRDVRDSEEKERLLQEAEESVWELKVMGDLICGAALENAQKGDATLDWRLVNLGREVRSALEGKEGDPQRRMRFVMLAGEAQQMLDTGLPPGQPSRRPFHWALAFPEVFEEGGGFDGIVGNPPFQGGKKITGAFGDEYREYLVGRLAGGQRGSADLCAYFFLRGGQLVKRGGHFGLLATNTIAQGDTREVGLDALTASDCAVTRAIPSSKWPGEANLEVAHVWMRRGPWGGEYVLDGGVVRGITPMLTAPSRVTGKPFRLKANEGKSFQGSIVLGMGFVLTPEEARELIARDERNREVLFPYLNGDDLNSRPDQSPSRWVINFRDWSQDRARAYTDCWAIVEARVRPERQRQKSDGTYVLRSPLPQRYWHYADKRPALYSAIAGMESVLVCPVFTKHHLFAWVKAEVVFMNKLYVFGLRGPSQFSLLGGTIHELWARKYSATLETRLQYAPTDCFETFPFPLLTPASQQALDSIGSTYHSHRQSVMLGRQEGLTKTYNRFHNPKEESPDIERLRWLHMEMDRAVAAAYGWTDLELEHGFHDTRQGLRFTVSERARVEILDRLLELNHARHAEEVAQGLHSAPGKKKPPRRPKSAAAPPAAPTQGHLSFEIEGED